MNWIIKLFEKADWRFVGQIKAPYHLQTVPKIHHTLTYYLYEDQNGNRKIDVIDSDSDRGDLNVKSLDKTDWVFRNKHYTGVIHPWLTGFRNPDFPTYESAPRHDFKRLLKGSK